MNATYMLGTAYIVGTLDVAEVVFLLFVLFFIGLVFYLNKESRREGYPLEHELTGEAPKNAGGSIFDGAKKTFKLPHDRGTYTPEDVARDPVDVPGKRHLGTYGAPYVPDGDPMKSGMGPGAYAKRATYPDLTFDGRNRIVPLALAHELDIAPKDETPVGLSVFGADGVEAGKVSDVWVDQSEHIIRYLEVETASGKKVLLPMTVAKVRGEGLFGGTSRTIEVSAIKAHHFDDVPGLAKPGEITRDEEERVMAYYGGGFLYADPSRQEPVV